MKILYWVELFRPDIGGVEVGGVQFLHELQRRGHECVVAASHGRTSLPDETIFECIPVRRFPFQRRLLEKNLPAARALSKQVADWKQSWGPDLIHLRTSQPSLFFHLRSQTSLGEAAPPVVATVCEPLMPGVSGNSMLGQSLREAASIAAVSQAVRMSLESRLDFVAPKTSVIPNGLLVPEQIPQKVSCEPPRLFCAGRMVPEKGFDIMVRALPEILQGLPQTRLICAGDGPERGRLQSLAVKLGVERSVDFPGWIPPEDIPRLIEASSLIVVPSRWEEPFGLVALQGALMARPVIAARVGGLPEIVLDRQTGLLFDRDDSRSLARAVILLLRDAALAVRLGAAAREWAIRDFGLGRQVDSYERLYHEALQPAARSCVS